MLNIRSKDEKKNLRDIPIGIRAEEALKIAVANAIADHKRFGDPMVIWRDEKIVKIPADQIELLNIRPDTNQRSCGVLEMLF